MGVNNDIKACTLTSLSFCLNTNNEVISILNLRYFILGFENNDVNCFFVILYMNQINLKKYNIQNMKSQNVNLDRK